MSTDTRQPWRVYEPWASACHCLCANAHPDSMGICRAFKVATTLRYGATDVPVCQPCADAVLGAEPVPSDTGEQQ
jgi:hypothetical protein